MSTVPPPSMGVLAELDVPVLAQSVAHTSTPLARAWANLAHACDAHAAALSALNRVEVELVAAHGHPRVVLPTAGALSPTYALDPSTIEQHLGRGPAARRLTAALRRRQRRFAIAAEATGLRLTQAREARAYNELGVATASLLLTPVGSLAEARLKLAVLIASVEAQLPGALMFPGVHLRALIADLAMLDEAVV